MHSSTNTHYDHTSEIRTAHKRMQSREYKTERKFRKYEVIRDDSFVTLFFDYRSVHMKALLTSV